MAPCVRVVRLSIPKAGPVHRDFVSVTGNLWASPAYVAQRGAPATPESLAVHSCLLFSMASRDSIRLTDGTRHVEIGLHPVITTDDLETLRELALRGVGVAPLPDFIARDH
ncbi:MAG: LysR substrate-binding domain-containing protein, partial [Burkholderiales bacterium]